MSDPPLLHLKSVKSEIPIYNKSTIYDPTSHKPHRMSESAFITSVPKLGPFARFGNNLYDSSLPIDENDEIRDRVHNDIMVTYNKLHEIIQKLEDRIVGVIELSEQDFL